MSSYFVFDTQRFYIGSFSGEHVPTDTKNNFVKVTQKLSDQLDAARLEAFNEFELTGIGQGRHLYDSVAQTITPKHLRVL